MSNPFLRVLTGGDDRRIVESVVPQRTLDDVILPPATRRSLEQALVHVTQHDLVAIHLAHAADGTRGRRHWRQPRHRTRCRQ
jgi:hypothetical protein